MPRLRRPQIARILCLAGAAMSLSGTLPLAAPAMAQGSRETAREYTNAQLLTDFIHYVKIDQRELADSFGRALLARQLSPTEFVNLVDDTPQAGQRFQEAILRALRDAALEDVASQLASLYEAGQIEQIRNPDAITRNIDLLGEGQRARTIARQRLLEAGEYAVPQLLDALVRGDRPNLQFEAQRLLIDLGPDAVVPLGVAMLQLSASAQERIASMLGRIGYRQALPYLAELAQGGQHVDAGVRTAAQRAIREIDPTAASMPPADLYVQLADEYYREPVELTRFQGEAHQLYWEYRPGIGLFPVPVRTEVYHEAMAMRLTERALELDPRVDGAVSLWVASNLSRELEQPEEYDNPVYGVGRRDATYYAVAAGPSVLQRVLARGLADRDTALVRRTINALSKTAGDASFIGGAQSQPLVAALSYPDRRVQFEAALALGLARPQQTFVGADRVVPILGSAIRDADRQFAIILADSIEREQRLDALLQSAGYTVVGRSGSLSQLAGPIADAPGIDLVVVDAAQSQFRQALDSARSTSKLTVTPVLGLLPFSDFTELAPTFENDDLVRVARRGLDDEQIIASVQALQERASGGVITEEAARAYSLLALDALRDIAGGSTIFDASDATTPLLSALTSQGGRVQLSVADVLSRIDEPRAQRGLADAALAASGGERIALMSMVAESAKRFGSMLEERQVARLVEVAQGGEGDEATEAAALLGALNLPGNRVVPLILERG